ENMAEWLVGRAADIKEGDRKIVTAGKREIGIFHKNGAFYAYSNTCLHQGGPACEGMMIQNVVDVIDKDHLYQGQTYGDEMHFVCPWHGYEYDLKTGECIGERKQKLRKYEVVKRGEDIYVVALTHRGDRSMDMPRNDVRPVDLEMYSTPKHLEHASE